MKGLTHMKNRNRALSILLTLILTLTAAVFPASAEENPAEGRELIVGHTTETKGDFFTEMFGNNTADIDVRALIHAYNLVNWDQAQGVYLFDESVVEDVMVLESATGDKTYYFALYDDLRWSDGTPITAWDYAFSLLLMMSREIEQIGGKIYRNEHILGSDDYMTGKVPYLSGVGVLDEHQLAITLDHNFLPYFFETGLFLCVPYPIQEIAPGCRVYAGEAEEDGDEYGFGIRIGNEDETVSEPVYTAELLKKTVLDPDNGYNSHPKIVSGPYVLTEYDGTTCRFEINEYYKGAWVYNTLPDIFYYNRPALEGVGHGRQSHNNGKPLTATKFVTVDRLGKDGKSNPLYLVQPTIEKISFKLVNNDTVEEQFRNGEVHLVNKLSYEPTVNALLANKQLDEQDYPRVGMSFLTFSFEWKSVHEKEVRQAIAWCMDRDQITEDYCGKYGKRVDGYFGIEEWEYLICTKQLPYPINFRNDVKYTPEETQERLKHRNMYAFTEEEYKKLVAEWELLNLDDLTVYKVDTEKANAILDDSGWTLNPEGGEYDSHADTIRCKMVDGELVKLDLKMMYPEGNHIIDTIQENFIDNLNKCGIQLTLVPAAMDDLLSSYYRETERTTDMIYLATNFHVMVDPSITYSTDKSANHELWNNTYSDDEDLYWRAVNMRQTDPRDIYDYVAKWVSFQERYNVVLPTIPIYSNIYFDFFVPELTNYYITAHVTWTQAILEAEFK